jgi:hypothetical protein
MVRDRWMRWEEEGWGLTVQEQESKDEEFGKMVGHFEVGPD